MFARIVNRMGKRGLLAGGLATVALVVLGALLAVSLLPSTGRPAHASGTGGGCFAISGPVCTFKNQTAFADFENSSSDGCVVTDTFIQSFANLVRPGNSNTQTAFVDTVKFDNCNGGVVSEAFAQDFTGTVQFSTGLASASVVGTATMFDDQNGTTFPLSINVTWQGFGSTTRLLQIIHSRAPGFVFMGRVNGSTRGAEASGTISDGTTNFAAIPSLNANISDNSGGSVQLSTP